MLFYRWYQGYFQQKFLSLIENIQFYQQDKCSVQIRDYLHWRALALAGQDTADQAADSEQKAASQNFLLMCYDESP